MHRCSQEGRDALRSLLKQRKRPGDAQTTKPEQAL